MSLTTADLRRQLELAADEGDEGHLAMLLVAAKRAAENYTDRVIFWEPEDRPSEETLVPVSAIDASGDIELGVLAMAAHWFENREAVTADAQPRTVPFTIGALWGPHRYYGDPEATA